MAAFRSPNPIQCICPSLHSTVRGCHQSTNGTGTPKVGAILKETLHDTTKRTQRSDALRPNKAMHSVAIISSDISWNRGDHDRGTEIVSISYMQIWLWIMSDPFGAWHLRRAVPCRAHCLPLLIGLAPGSTKQACRNTISWGCECHHQKLNPTSFCQLIHSIASAECLRARYLFLVLSAS